MNRERNRIQGKCFKKERMKNKEKERTLHLAVRELLIFKRAFQAKVQLNRC